MFAGTLRVVSANWALLTDLRLHLAPLYPVTGPIRVNNDDSGAAFGGRLDASLSPIQERAEHASLLRGIETPLTVGDEAKCSTVDEVEELTVDSESEEGYIEIAVASGGKQYREKSVGDFQEFIDEIEKTDLSSLEAAHLTSPAPGCRMLSGQTKRISTFSRAFSETLREAVIAAQHEVTVLISGETGTGKTLLARLIHEVSPRREEQFQHVACGTLPSELIESELFGHTRGAFTGADRDKIGRFSAADSGTLLLDEIDVLGSGVQSKLLRVLETGEYERVGSLETLRSGARVIAASNQDLEELCAKSEFRSDLYFRLNMISLQIPPLRERVRDIAPLAVQFVGDFATKYQKPIAWIEDRFLQALCAYSWPGNVRELEHVIHRCVLMCTDDTLCVRALPAKIREKAAAMPETTSGYMSGNDSDSNKSLLDLVDNVRHAEREVIREALVRNKFNRTRTARELGICRVTLQKKIKRYGLQRYGLDRPYPSVERKPR